MKKIIYTTILMLAVSLSVRAQSHGISIENLKTDIRGEMLDLRFHIRTSGLDIDCDGQLTLEFAIENADRRLVLPVVVYSGAQRYRFEERRSILSDGFHVEPYQIYKGAKKGHAYDLEYAMSVPYYSWMEHAAITYREYEHGCSGNSLQSAGALVFDLNPAPVVEPTLWAPDSQLYPNLVSFLVPEVEEVKSRASMLELNIGFPVNVTEVRPTFGDNGRELNRADSLIISLQGNTLIEINGVNIKGYASPEGSYAINERLAKGRSQGFKQYLARNYPNNRFIAGANTLWVAEDWEGLARLVRESNLPNKEEVMPVVLNSTMSPDSKEKVLQNIGQYSYVYKPMLEQMFPKLRRIELRVDYTVNRLSDNQARELLYAHPDLLSLDEIYRVARFYEPGSHQYREVYEIAARQYPDDVVANNNAAAAYLQEGNTEAALPYLQKIAGKDDTLINFGTYYYISGNLEKAIEYFERAKNAGSEQAGHNLNLINGR